MRVFIFVEKQYVSLQICLMAVIKREFALRGRGKAAAAVLLFAIKEMKELFLFMALQTMRKMTCPQKNFMFSRSLQKFCLVYHKKI